MGNTPRYLTIILIYMYHFEKMLYAVLVLVFGCFISHSNGQTEVGVGQECWSSTGGVHQCASGLMCSHWHPNGEIWDGQSPWYCLFSPKHTEGQICLRPQGGPLRFWSDLLQWTLRLWNLSNSNP